MKKVICFLLILCPYITLSNCRDKAREAEAYARRVKLVGDLILGQTSAYISQSKAYIAVWEYAKASGEDFKTSTRHVLGAQHEHNKIEFLSMKQNIAERLDKLADPPRKYTTAYEKLLALHNLYLKLHSLALNPAPSQEKYEKSVNELGKKIQDAGEEFYSLLGI
jgi:hypothetical protein